MIHNKKLKREIYFKEFRSMNPSLVFGLIIISFGLYMISWLYTRNREFELLDRYAPDAARGTAVLFLLPLSWLMIVFTIKNIIGFQNLFIDILEIVVWVGLIFLVLKYFLDFCLSFGRITGTTGIYWFFVCIFLFIAIPAMQSELNSHFERMDMRRKSNTFYR